MVVNSNSKWIGFRNKMRQGRCVLRMCNTCCGGENRALLGCYAASCGDSLPTFRDKLSVPSRVMLALHRNDLPLMGPDRLSRNVGNELPLRAV